MTAAFMSILRYIPQWGEIYKKEKITFDSLYNSINKSEF